MTLTNTAYLEIEADTNATFEMDIGYETRGDSTKSYLMGERGQYIREAVNQTPGTGSFDADRRTGFWIDGGAGNWVETVTFRSGLTNVQWGDGDGGTGPSNVTQTDASGENVPGISRKNIFDYWIAKSKSDSGGTTKLHFGEWTDGNIAHISGVSSAAFGQPMPVAITNWDVGVDTGQEAGVSVATGSFTASHVALWGGGEAPDWANDAVGAALEAANFIPDE